MGTFFTSYSLLQISSSVTLSVAQIIAFITDSIDAICADLLKQRKQPALSTEQVMLYVQKRFFAEDFSGVSADFRHFSEVELLEQIKHFLYTLLTVGDKYYLDFEVLVKSIKCNPEFAKKFFYGHSIVPKESIARMRGSLISKFRNFYGITLSDQLVASIIYAHLFDDGTWQTLNDYSFRSSFFSWLNKVSSNAIKKFLQDESHINPSRLTPGNSRLVWKSKSPEKCQLMLDELILPPFTYSFLSALMGDRLTEQQIMLKFSLTETAFKKTLVDAEKVLSAALLNQVHCFEDFLTSRNAPRYHVSSDQIIYKSDPTAFSENNPFYGIFDDHAGEDYQDPVEQFVIDFSDNFFDDSTDLIIFKQRFLYDSDPVSLGLELGRKRSNIDCRYSRCMTEIFPAFRSWYALQTNPRKRA